MSLRILEALFLQTAHTLKCQTWQFSVPVIILLWEKMAFLILPHALRMQTIASGSLIPLQRRSKTGLVWGFFVWLFCFALFLREHYQALLVFLQIPLLLQWWATQQPHVLQPFLLWSPLPGKSSLNSVLRDGRKTSVHRWSEQKNKPQWD